MAPRRFDPSRARCKPRPSCFRRGPGAVRGGRVRAARLPPVPGRADRRPSPAGRAAPDRPGSGHGAAVHRQPGAGPPRVPERHPVPDPSGIRLRAWLGLAEPDFYDAGRIAIVPMGACFPGHDAKGGDLPPRRECAATWRRFAARRPAGAGADPGDRPVRAGLAPRHGEGGPHRDGGALARDPGRAAPPRVLPLPHPSWRNSAWLKKHPWFETELLPVLRAEVARVTGAGSYLGLIVFRRANGRLPPRPPPAGPASRRADCPCRAFPEDMVGVGLRAIGPQRGLGRSPRRR